MGGGAAVRPRLFSPLSLSLTLSVSFPSAASASSDRCTPAFLMPYWASMSATPCGGGEGGAAQRAQRAASSRPLSRHPPSDLGAVGPVLLQHEREHAGVGLGEEEGMGTVGARAAARARAHQPWTPAVDRRAPCWCARGGERRERGCAGGARAARVDAGRAEGERLTPDAGASGGRATTTSALGERAEGAGAAECGGGGGGGALSRFVFAGRCPRPTALNTARTPQC